MKVHIDTISAILGGHLEVLLSRPATAQRNVLGSPHQKEASVDCGEHSALLNI
jgi:hypothetical protein